MSLQGGPSNISAHGVDFEKASPEMKQALAACRKFKPHVVFTDRPDNYVAFPAEHWDQQGKLLNPKS